MNKKCETQFINELINEMKTRVVTLKVKHYELSDWYEHFPIEGCVHGTLAGYEEEFHKPYMHREGNRFLVFWDVDMKEWRALRCINIVEKEAV